MCVSDISLFIHQFLIEQLIINIQWRIIMGVCGRGKKTYIQRSFVAILTDVDSAIQTKSH